MTPLLAKMVLEHLAYPPPAADALVIEHALEAEAADRSARAPLPPPPLPTAQVR